MATTLRLRGRDGDHTVTIDGKEVIVDGTEVQIPPRAYTVVDGDTRWVFLDGDVYEFEVVREGRKRAASHHGSLTAPMPATVVRINAEVGSAVKRGDTVLVLEAMKMELPVRSPANATVKAVTCREGDLVQPDTVLIQLDTDV